MCLHKIPQRASLSKSPSWIFGIAVVIVHGTCALADFHICEASRTASIADFLCFSPGKACKFSRGFLDSGLKRLDAGSLF